MPKTHTCARWQVGVNGRARALKVPGSICIDAAALVPILAYIAAYVIVPRAQQASFVNIGIVTLLRVEESDFDSSNILLISKYQS